MADQTQPWAERTVDMPPQLPPVPQSYQRGVAQVAPRESAPVTPSAPREPSGTGWPEREPDPRWAQRGHHRGQWRIGSGWTVFGTLVAFVFWGIWAISTRGDLTSPVLTFALSLAVAAGLFALSRLVGRVILERQLGRVRRSARGAHMITAIFLVGVGVAYLRQTKWVMDLFNLVRGLF